MSKEAMGANVASGRRTSFVRLGGVAGLLTALTALTLNFLLVAPAPEFNAPVGEIASYVAEHADGLALSNRLRYVVYLFLVFFGVGLYRLVVGLGQGDDGAWATIGLLGTIWIAAAGTVANSVEAAGIWQAHSAAEQPQLLIAIWGISGALFIAVQLGWGSLMLGFSVAGRLTGMMPLWLVGLGIVSAATCFVGAIGVLSVMRGGWVELPAFASFALFSVWVAATSILMLRKPNRD